MSNKRQENSTNLYIKNFGKDIDESKLCQLFSSYGVITSCKIQTDQNGQSKGFGFVNFERSEMAKNAIEKLNGHLLEDGQRLYVGYFQKKAQRVNELRRIHEENLTKRSNDLCLYISNLDTTVNETILEGLFSRFGKITKVHILSNGTQSKGIAFVCFETMEQTTRALNEMNGKWILSKPIYVKLSKHHDDSQSIIPSNSPSPSTVPLNPPIPPTVPSYPRLMSPMPYTNTPTPMMFYIPTLMIRPPPMNNYPMPVPTPIPQIPTTQERPPSSTTPKNRQHYPYVRVKSEEQ